MAIATMEVFGGDLIMTAGSRIQDDAGPLHQTVRQLPAANYGFQYELLACCQNEGYF
jgi:hypothetical protein